MTTPPESPAPAHSIVRDLVAVVLVLLGIGGVDVAAFAYDWRLGLLSVGAEAAGLGLALARAEGN